MKKDLFPIFCFFMSFGSQSLFIAALNRADPWEIENGK